MLVEDKFNMVDGGSSNYELYGTSTVVVMLFLILAGSVGCCPARSKLIHYKVNVGADKKCRVGRGLELVTQHRPDTDAPTD